ncbi:peptide/nickel transport system substrate-binding protein [Shimia gijangensis]|uniref:Peptide/nickel transport system substrate-binding protein n=1 Tax=Shimia gijangensis TaxID=1470563 RepID=A0A1M6N1Z7_9RHOB|nr:ABC transporter substrate-binding protein [Shimia gijangensis]SHJ89694.1 peptide/nickel transport system substrate-binding protein [Shimia gijangensis]
MTEFRKNDPRYGHLNHADDEQLYNMIKRGATRRQVMQWFMAAGATAASSSLLFGSATKAFADTPKRGGRLVMAADQHGPNDTLDPALFASGADYFRGRMYYGSLTRLTDSLGYEPELAEEVISNPDATVWTFKIRKGVEFHDGKTLTADDVIYSMNRHMGADSVSKAASLVAMVDRWEKVSDYEVRAVLSSPNADLAIALGTFHFKIVQEGTTDFSTAIGTGPYRVKEFKPGVRAVGARFENYWGEGGYLDELEHYGIGDSVARLNAFMAGDVDAMVNLPPKAIEQVEAAEGRDVWSIESGAYINIAPRLDMAQSSNKHLHKALQHLMDRQRLVKGVYKGQASLGNDQPISSAYFDHNPDIPQRMLDPEKAKYHFEKSGLRSTTIPIVTADLSPGTVEQCLYLQREGAKIGMNIDVKKVTTDGYWGAVWLKEPIAVAVVNMRPTANILMSLLFKSDAKWNETRWHNEQFDQTLVEVRGVTDAAKRKQMYGDLQTMIHEENGMVIPVHRNYVDAAASHVKGRTHVPLNNFGGSESPVSLWRDS